MITASIPSVIRESDDSPIFNKNQTQKIIITDGMKQSVEEQRRATAPEPLLSDLDFADRKLNDSQCSINYFEQRSIAGKSIEIDEPRDTFQVKKLSVKALKVV